MENKIRNQSYLAEYSDILERVLKNKLNGQSILYIVKGILITRDPLESCWGFAMLDDYLQQHRKIEYIKKHTSVLETKLMDRLDGQSILYMIKEILVSTNPLKICPEYLWLNQYINEKEKIQPTQERNEIQEELGTLHILSSVINLASRGHDMGEVSRIVSLFPYVEESSDNKTYQKQNSYSA